MRRFADIPIKWKLRLAILGMMTLVLLLAAAALTYESFRARRELIRDAVVLAEFTANNSAVALAEGDADAGQEILGGLQALPGVDYAGLYNRDGKLVAQVSRDKRRPADSLDIQTETICKLKAGQLTVYCPVRLEGAVVGGISLCEDSRQQQERFGAYLSLVIPALVGLLVLALLLAAWLQNVIAYPLLELSRVAKLVTQQHDYSNRVERRGRDEVGSLVEAFNSMLAQIQQHDATLRESEERYRQVVELSPDALLIRRNGKVEFVNEAGVRLFGATTPSQLLGKSVLELVHPDWRPGVAERIRRLDAGEDAPPLEQKYLRLDGKPVDVEVAAARLTFGGKPAALVVVRDITERKQAEARFRGLLEAAPDAMVIVNREGRIVLVNAQTESMFGFSREELLGAPVERLLPERYRDAHRGGHADYVGAMRARPLGEALELFGLHKDGSEFPVEISLSPLETEQGTLITLAVRDVTRRKQAEEWLRESEERFRQLAENIREVFWMTDQSKTQMLYISPGYETIWGRSCESLYASPRSWVEAIHPEDHDRVLQAAMEQQTTGGYDEVYRIVRPDGSIRWIRDRAFPVRDESGGIHRIVGLAEDITANKQTEFRMAMLAHGVESTTQPICITDLQDRFIFVNRAFLKTYRYTEQEILGRTPEVLFSPNNPPSLLGEILEQTRQGGWRGEVLDRRNDGMDFPVLLTTSQIKKQNGEVIGLMGVAEDITERRRAESHIRLLANAVESTEELISITDCDDRFTFVNQAFLKAYGYTLEEVWGKMPESLRPADTAASFSEQIRNATMNGGWRGELINCRKDGSTFPIYLSTSAIKNHRGETIGLVGVARDITEIKRAEQRNVTFSALGSALSACTTPDGAGRIILNAAAELFGWDAAYVHLSEQEKGGVMSILAFDTIEGKVTEISPDSLATSPAPMTRRVMEQGAQLINSKGRSHSPGELVPFGDAAHATASKMFVPIHQGSNVIGILSVQSHAPNAYSAGQLKLFQSLADYCGGALQRIRALEALRDSEERFRTFFESAPIAVALHDAHGRFIQTNRSYQRMLGYSAEELQTLGVKRITRSEDVPEGGRMYGELLAGTREYYSREKRFIRKDGSEVWANSFASAVRDAGGKLRYIVSMVEDITDRKRSQAAVQELAWIVENSDDAIISNSLDGDIVSWNKAAERIYGYTAEEAFGQPISMLIPPDRTHELELVTKSLRAGAQVQEFETVHRRKDNTFVEVSLTISPIKDADGKLIAASAFVRDITERKRLEKEVLQISTDERRRVGHELHDGLGQVLTGIAFKTKALAGKLANSALPQASEAEEIVNLINGAIGQTRRLARGLDPIEIEASGLVAALGRLATETRVIFDVGCDFLCNDQALSVNDQTGLALYRITQEAIHNATSHGIALQIKIELSRSSGRLLLKISDDGRGFQPNRGEKGGMGLRIMQHRARSIGGVLTVNSRPRRGTIIECSIPLALCLAAAHDEGETPKSRNNEK